MAAHCARAAIMSSSTSAQSPTIGDVDLDVLADRGRVDVDVDLLGARREGVEAAR
jgi:hypothetical protein